MITTTNKTTVATAETMAATLLCPCPEVGTLETEDAAVLPTEVGIEIKGTTAPPWPEPLGNSEESTMFVLLDAGEETVGPSLFKGEEMEPSLGEEGLVGEGLGGRVVLSEGCMTLLLPGSAGGAGEDTEGAEDGGGGGGDTVIVAVLPDSVTVTAAGVGVAPLTGKMTVTVRHSRLYPGIL